MDENRKAVLYKLLHYKSRLLDESTVAKFATVQIEGERTVKRVVKHYNLDMILSVGYRVKSKRGIAFRRWANSILKQYLINGYAINERRMAVLQKTVEIQTKMLHVKNNMEIWREKRYN